MERAVFDRLSNLVSSGNYIFTPDSCKVIYKPRYFSHDRESNIVFDVGIVFPARSSFHSLPG